MVGAIGPWQTTFLVDLAGTDGDGVITLVLGSLAGLLLLTKRPGSGWLAFAGVLAGIGAVVAAYDLVQILNSEQEIFGQQVELVRPGWGLWLTLVASIALTAASAALWVEAPSSEV
ncbi:MAG TPA: hypothetical protein VLK37_01760 [Solirubrobacterales bacterium]|nr:hypothetical protein [Solirubrobacterales bacterium]